VSTKLDEVLEVDSDPGIRELEHDDRVVELRSSKDEPVHEMPARVAELY